jgi:hypothetical protein
VDSEQGYHQWPYAPGELNMDLYNYVLLLNWSSIIENETNAYQREYLPSDDMIMESSVGSFMNGSKGKAVKKFD